MRSVLEGRIRVQCHATLVARAVHEFFRWSQRHPIVYFIAFYLAVVAAVALVGYGGYQLVRG